MNYISHVYQNNILRIDFKGEIDSSNVVKIKDKINKLRRNYKPNKILFNFEEVTFIDSAGIGLILGRYNEYRLDHITLVLVGVNRSIKKLFIISGINQLMDMYESVNIGG
jgi:stage II sporulation protein AA (anti-sigma F factor antagonist)